IKPAYVVRVTDAFVNGAYARVHDGVNPVRIRTTIVPSSHQRSGFRFESPHPQSDSLSVAPQVKGRTRVGTPSPTRNRRYATATRPLTSGTPQELGFGPGETGVRRVGRKLDSAEARRRSRIRSLC